MRTYRGFSLIEMLVALVILSLSLGVLYQAAMGATRNVRVASEYNEAMMIAESVLSEHSAVFETGVQHTGSFGDYQWRAQVLPLVDDISEGGATTMPLAEVVVTVSWEGGARDRQLVLASIFPVLDVPTGAAGT